MRQIKTLKEIANHVKGSRKRLVVAGGNVHSVIQSIAKGVRNDIIRATLVGDKEEILKLSDKYEICPSLWNIIDEKEPAKIAEKSVELIKSGEADILMKGFISSADYSHAILNRKHGLVEAGGLLSHAAVVQIPQYHKLLIISDAAILVQPDLSQKIAMLKFCVDIAHKMGISRPKAGIISCVEKTSFKIDSTIDASIICKMAKRGQIQGVDVDGPLALDLAISKRCAREKKYKSNIAGDCDIMIFPNICSANIFFKTVTNLAGARAAAMVVGASVPCILTSRSDTEKSKFFSIALAALLSNKNEGGRYFG
ncbi:MAG: phosphate butyryltransferase [Armatimonadetes bacterium]|nr:phosphate butyryltransferase [Armatimonadota bacterium]